VGGKGGGGGKGGEMNQALYAHMNNKRKMKKKKRKKGRFTSGNHNVGALVTSLFISRQAFSCSNLQFKWSFQCLLWPHKVVWPGLNIQVPICNRILLLLEILQPLSWSLAEG
jgi:hypothetical protein